MSYKKALPEKRELYFEVGAEGGGDDLFRIKKANGSYYFIIEHNSYDFEEDTVTYTYTEYSSFAEYFNQLTGYKRWYMLHPLFIHPEIREVVKAALDKVDWQKDKPTHTEYSKENWERVLRENKEENR
jgi:hypothetical protein